MIGPFPGNNFVCFGLSHGRGIGNLSIFFFMPAMLSPNLGLTCYLSFDSVGTCGCGVTTGFIIGFSGLTFGSTPLSVPCTFVIIVPLVFA